MAKNTQPTKQHTYGNSSVETQSSSSVDLTNLENKITLLETKLNENQSRVSFDLSSLPDLPPRKETNIIKRVDAIENKLEALIQLLSN